MCRLMDQVIPYNMKSHVFLYLDDLLIMSESFEEHLQHLRDVASQFRKAGLTVNVKKNFFAVKLIKFFSVQCGRRFAKCG